MIAPEQHAQIRRLFYAEHWPVHTIAAQLGLHHDTVRRAIESDRFIRPGMQVRPSALDPYKALGRPVASVAFGGFAEWAGVLGGVLKVAGITGFLANRRTLFDQADEESAHVRAFLADWWKEHHDAPVLVKALIELAKGHPLPIASRSEQGALIRLGQLVKSLEDRRYDLGECLRVAVRRAGAAKRAVLWRLVGESDESDESSCVNTHARAGAQAREGRSAGEDSPDSQTHQELRL